MKIPETTLYQDVSSRAAQDAVRWSAVCRRTSAPTPSFLYAVRTTGVYCRPDCSARQPLRKNVSFFETCAEAESAGYRHCKRCTPDQLPRSMRHAELITSACRQLEEGDEEPNLEALAARAGLSRFHFHRLFKATTGLTPKRYALAKRYTRLRDHLRDGETITHAMYDSGFNSPSNFYASAKNTLGMTPRHFRNHGENLAISFAFASTTLGEVLVAYTAIGICAILLGVDRTELERDLRARFKRAHCELSPPETTFSLGNVIALIELPTLGHKLPLDIRGTAFQQQVWQALQKIPPGTTISYGALATRVGSPGAARAVALACAANPLAVAIPCHRVVRGDGAISGYRWGVERKRALLAREKVAMHDQSVPEAQSVLSD